MPFANDLAIQHEHLIPDILNVPLCASSKGISKLRRITK